MVQMIASQLQLPIVEWNIGIFDGRKASPLPLSQKFTVLDWHNIAKEDFDAVLQIVTKRSANLLRPYRRYFVERDLVLHRAELQKDGCPISGLWGFSIPDYAEDENGNIVTNYQMIQVAYPVKKILDHLWRSGQCFASRPRTDPKQAKLAAKRFRRTRPFLPKSKAKLQQVNGQLKNARFPIPVEIRFPQQEMLTCKKYRRQSFRNGKPSFTSLFTSGS